MRRRGTISRRAPGDAGFSLVESLATLVVVSMIGLMLTAGITTGRRVWDRVDGVTTEGEALEAVQDTLRDRLEGTYPATKFITSPPSSDFEGKPDSVIFLANPAYAARPSPLRRYTLAVNAAGKLILSSITDLGQPEDAVIETQVLLSGVRQVDIAYFGASAPDRLRRWRRDWQSQPAPPEIVRIRVTFEPGDRRQWPDLLVHPRATIDASCQISTLTHRCKGRA